MQKVKRRILRWTLAMMSVVVLVVLWGWQTSWRRLPHYNVTEQISLPVPIMSSEEYAKIIDVHPRPYLVRIETKSGSVLIFGAEHTKNPQDPQIAEIRREWESFNPTVALCESRLGILFPQLMEPVREFGEPGAVHALARESNVPTYTWEPTPAVYVSSLSKQPFTKEQLALRLKLGPYFSNLRFGKPADPEAFVADSIGDGSKWPGLESTLSTPQELDAAWKKQFPSGPDWRDVSDQYGLPGFLGRIDTNVARDEHFIRVIVELVRKGERVFAIAGVSHVVKIESAVKGALSELP